ncbi:hypothetical protein SAY87_005130 [Trapa incisa]|uniref:Ubiquitin carboxyl-terminal hydrolase n=1 Tax=Trapa incisa TaxID=236973 RepID=A0AAN7JQU1_9MYRT|nr:hypothetical protein SAY87_005130 [Trapa incisa]
MALPPPPQQLQMNWQTSFLGQKRKTGPPLGLRNLGNSCYLNSVLQCLTYTPPLANFCLRNLHSSLCDSSVDGEKKRDCPFCILEKRIARSLKVDLAQDAPSKILCCLQLFAQHFRIGRQEDAHEFLRYVIDTCHNTCIRLKKLQQHQQRKGCSEASIGDDSTIVKEIFGGSLQSQVKCSSCGSESKKIDEIMDISLDVLHSSSLKEALRKFFQPELLDGNNKYKCENCQKLVVARKQMLVFQAPNVLVIQLKRFDGMYGGKIDKVVSFDDVLVLSSFMCKKSQDSSPEYHLFGTIVHSGCSLDSGHYYAYIKDAMGRWYCCNDAYVTQATLEEVLSEKVYILFFSRSRQRPVSSTDCLLPIEAKSQNCNGNGTYKRHVPDPPSKLSHMKPLVEESAWTNVSMSPKLDMVQAGPKMKFNIAGNAGSRRVPTLVNGKVEPYKNNLVEANGDVEDLVQLYKSDKYKLVSPNGNVHGKENRALFVGGKNNQTIDPSSCDENDQTNGFDAEKSEPSVYENGHCIVRDRVLDSVKSVLCESNGVISREAKISEHGYRKHINGSDPCHLTLSGLKRKLHESHCILLAQDAQSRAKVEELKELLRNDASSVLRTCGWLEEVYNFMHLKKRSYMAQVSSASGYADYLKQKLIADAKPIFSLQIPNTLKEELIRHLRSFSQERR